MAAFVYHYHPQTYVYLGQSKADASPLEPGVFLVPAHSTLVAPTAEINDNQHHVWDPSNCVWTPKFRPEEPVGDDELPTIPEELPEPIEQLRALRNERLKDVDWVAIKYFTLGVPYPEEWATYVQALRDLPATVGELLVDSNGRLLYSSIAWPVQPAN